MSRIARFMLMSAAALFGASFSMPPPPAPDYDRRRRRGRDKHTQGYLTVQANGGRLTKRGKRGYGLTPCEAIDPDAYLNSHARAEKHRALFD